METFIVGFENPTEDSLNEAANAITNIQDIGTHTIKVLYNLGVIGVYVENPTRSKEEIIDILKSSSPHIIGVIENIENEDEYDEDLE